MKLSIGLILFAATLLAGCSRPVVKETIVEKPVVVEKQQPVVVDRPPVVVERPAAAGATTPPSCVYASQSYSHGSVSCQDRTQFRCDNGNWTRTLNAC